MNSKNRRDKDPLVSARGSREGVLRLTEMDVVVEATLDDRRFRSRSRSFFQHKYIKNILNLFRGR